MMGEMRPGSLTRQKRTVGSKTLWYWQVSYTHQMKSGTDYVRAENVENTKAQIAEFKKFRKLVDEWVALAIEHAKLKGSDQGDRG
jgi:hypothetical protein